MALPLIDLAHGTPQAQARAIDDALSGAGFFTITGHGVDAAVVSAAHAASRAFFALPEARKRQWHIRDGRGFDPIGWQALDVGQPADLKESFYIGEEIHGRNQWPDDAAVPGFRAACEAYAAAMQRLARRLAGLCALALGLPADAFDGAMRAPICTTRLLHYPPQPASAAPGQIGCGAHTDWGALTLLWQDDAGGLQVFSRNEWLEVTPQPGSFVVNSGDLMQRWTNDRWRSTRHRVINRHSGRDRWSIAYFFDLDADAVIEPLPGCTGAGNPARYPPITPAAHLAEMYRRTTVAAEAGA